MKKLFALVSLVLLLVMLAVPTLAAGTAQITFTPSKTTVSRGDEVVVTVSISKVDSCTSGLIVFNFDSSVFDWVSGSALLDADLASVKKDPTGAYVGSFTYSTDNPQTVSGNIFQFKLKVKSNAVLNKTTSVTCVDMSFKNTSGAVATTVQAASVTVTCKHVYDNGCDTTCNLCGATRSPNHTYSNACDTTCNVCGATRSITHSYGSKWSSDANRHWHECTVCGAEKDVAAHTPGPAPTEDSPQKCTVCGYVLKPALSHTHHFDEEVWAYDADGHGHPCSGCDELGDYEDHVFDNDCDPDCNVCGYIREVEHRYADRWSFDESGHWHECSICGDRLETTPHVPGPEATGDSPQICTVCGYVIVPALHTHSFSEEWLSDETDHWHQCDCGTDSGREPHVWDDGTVTLEPTGTEEGLKTYICTVCGTEKTEPIPVLTPAEPEPEPSVLSWLTARYTLPMWAMIAAGAGAVICCGLCLLLGFLLGKKKRNKPEDSFLRDDFTP